MSFTDQTCTSTDGTTIGYRKLGRGPGLVIVHGSLRSADDYMRLAGYLADAFTVYVVDRRGRGASGPQGPGYSLQKESEDIAAVLKMTEAKMLFGHSFGGAVALETALTIPLTKLAVFEPAVSTDNAISGEAMQALGSALARRRYGKALMAVFQIVGDTSAKLPLPLRVAFAVPMVERAIFASPPGKRLRTLLQATLEECRVTREADGGHEKYQAIQVETLLLHGAQSPEWLVRASNRLSKILSNSQVVALEGVSHSAPCEDAPEEVAKRLTGFFTER